MPCNAVASYLRDTWRMPSNGSFFVARSGRTKQGEADGQRVRDLLRAAGYTNISEKLWRCGAAAETPE
jgi:hypothetical protein